MASVGENRTVDGLAKAISIIFHPGFQQFYLVLFYAIRDNEGPLVIASAVVTLFIIPAAFYMWYKKHVLREDNIYHMQRKDRFWPIAVNFLGLCVFAVFTILYTEHSFSELPAAFADTGRMPENVVTVSGVMVILNIIAQTITTYYKISLHMLGTATSTYLFWALGGPWLMLALALPILLAVGWSRLHLKSHTFPEVGWGTLVGSGYAIVILGLLGYLF